MTAIESLSPQQAAEQAATRIVQQYYEVRDHLRQDRSQPTDRLEDVAISTELNAYQRLIAAERKAGLHQTGDTNIAELKVQAVDLDNSDPAAGKVPTVQIDVCYDVAGVDLVDKDGKSDIEPGRANSGWVRHTVANYDWDSDPNGGWRVASSKDLERTPCDA